MTMRSRRLSKAEIYQIIHRNCVSVKAKKMRIVLEALNVVKLSKVEMKVKGDVVVKATVVPETGAPVKVRVTNFLSSS